MVTIPPKKYKHWLTRTRCASKGWSKKFLAALSEIPNVAYACDQAHINRKSAYDCRDRDPAFAKEWDDAIATAIEGLEEAVWRRSKEGVVKPVWMKDENGKPVKVDETREFSDGLAAFMLKAHKPKMYREAPVTVATQNNVQVNVPEARPLNEVSEERLRQLAGIEDAAVAVDSEVKQQTKEGAKE